MSERGAGRGVWRGGCGTLLLVALMSCRRPVAAAPTLDSLATQYVSLMVQLGERDIDSLDFAIDLDAAETQVRLYPATFAALHQRAVDLRGVLREAAGPVDEARRQLLLGQVEALILRSEQLQGHNRSFDDESRVLMGVIAPADADAGRRKVLRARIGELLGDSRHTAEAYARLGAPLVVPPDRVLPVFQAALQECRAITLQHMELPAKERVDVQLVGLKPWSAFSRYLGDAHSMIQLNMDYPLTVDQLLELACHEGYPGHHVFNLMRDAALVGQQHRMEFRVQPTFSPQSYVSEAAASYAPELALSRATRLHIDRDVLAPIAGLGKVDFGRYLAVQELVDALHTAEPSIAREYLDGSLDFARASDALQHETLMLHGEVTLLYLNEFRTYMLAYTQGEDAMRGFVEGGGADEAERWRRYRGLMAGPVVGLGR